MGSGLEDFFKEGPPTGFLSRVPQIHLEAEISPVTHLFSAIYRGHNLELHLELRLMEEMLHQLVW